jgi:hypothetical protein
VWSGVVGVPSYFISRMDYIGEIIALGIDTILFGLCYRLYVKQRNAIVKVEVCVQKSTGSPEG